MKRTKVLRVAAVCAFSAALIFTSCQPTTGIEDQSKTEKTESEQKNETEEKTDEKKEEKVEEKKEESEEKTDEKTEEKTEDKTDEKTDEKTEDKTDEKADDKVEDKKEETVTKYDLVSTDASPFVIKFSDGEYCELKGIVPDETTYKTGDKLKFVVKGKADKEITNFKLVFVDCAADTVFGTAKTYGYNILAEKAFDDAETIAANTDFEKSVTIELTANQIGTGADAHRVRLYADGEETIKIYPQGTDTEAKLQADIAAEEEAKKDGNLINGETVIAWDLTCKVDASKFADATNSSKIKVTLNCTDADGIAMKWHNGDWSPLFGAGTFTGATITFDAEVADNDHVVRPDPKTVGEHVITYAPTADEWKKIKEEGKGFVISGAGATVTKIQLEK